MRDLFIHLNTKDLPYAILLTTYNIKSRRNMYEEVIKYYKKHIPLKNLYVVDSYGVGFDCIPETQQLVFDQTQTSDDFWCSVAGPTCPELTALKKASQHFTFDGVNTVFKLTCKYKIDISDLRCLHSAAEHNPLIVLQNATQTHGQNCEIIGFRRSFFTEAIQQCISQNWQIPLEGRLLKFGVATSVRLPLLKLQPPFYPRSAGDILKFL